MLTSWISPGSELSGVDESTFCSAIAEERASIEACRAGAGREDAIFSIVFQAKMRCEKAEEGEASSTPIDYISGREGTAEASGICAGKRGLEIIYKSAELKGDWEKDDERVPCVRSSDGE
jgi:hypothetical protein